MILPIAQLPATVLRRPTQLVVLPLKKDLKRLIRDMRATVKKADGIGLAAPQISKSLKLALIYLEKTELDGLPLINPVITKSSSETELMEEGCLSMPGVFGIVERPKKITVKAFDLQGKEFSIEDDGLVARIIQHELDHLNGVLIIDKLKEVTRGKELIGQYRKK